MWRPIRAVSARHGCRPTRPGRAVAATSRPSLLPNIPFPSQAVPWPASLTRERATLVPARLGHSRLPLSDAAAAGSHALGGDSRRWTYHLLGGYANVQIRPKFGHRWPALLSPPTCKSCSAPRPSETIGRCPRRRRRRDSTPSTSSSPATQSAPSCTGRALTTTPPPTTTSCEHSARRAPRAPQIASGCR